MKYNELVISKQKKPMRVGRGISAGRGKTAGRGTKGQGSRKSPVKAGFEGGQISTYARIPKLPGFKSKRRLPENVYTGDLDKIKKAIVDSTALHEAGLISNPYVKVKLIIKGELTSKKDVRISLASAGAVKSIEKAGGSFSPTAQLPRPAKKSEKNSDK